MGADANQPSRITVAFHGTGSFYSVVKLLCVLITFANYLCTGSFYSVVKRVQKIGAFFLANIAYL
jgi:hypothetical protein